MFFSTILLALSSSIDALGLGITYGLKNTKISKSAYIILVLIFSSTATLSLIAGNIIKNYLQESVANFIGSFFIVCIGIFIIIQAFRQKKKEKVPGNVNNKDAILLGLALSIDSFGVIIGGIIAGISNNYFPIFISGFHLVLLLFGNFLGKKISKLEFFPDIVWSLLSGITITIIGILKLISI